MIADRLLAIAFEKLDKLEVGEAINKNTTKNWEIFLECVKQYDLTYKNIQIKSDYSEIRKVLTFKQQIEDYENKRTN